MSDFEDAPDSDELLQMLIYDLADALNYSKDELGNITCDPSVVVSEALDTIYQYKELMQ